MKKRSILLMLLTFILLFTSACNSTTEVQGEKEEKDEPKEDILNKTGFPIVNEPIELTFFTGKWDQGADQYEDTLVWSTYEKETNMKIDFQEVPFSELTEKRNLTLASGDYPDAFYSARIPAADIANYGKQGVFIPLNDMIDEYAPNLKKLFEEQPNLRKGLTMPDGNIYSIPSYYDPSFFPMLIGTPIWIKETWLEQLGMEEPQTTEEFYQYLKAVKETDLNGNGEADEIPYSGTGVGALIDQLKGAWGFGTRGLGHKFVDLDTETNELRFFRTDDKFKEVLEYVNKLYSEELLDPEIFTMDGTKHYAKGTEGNLGSTIVPNPVTVMNQDDYIGLGALKGPHGDQLYSHVKTPLVWPGAFAITDKNEHPEATLRWMDHFFGDEGATFYFMGVEDESYVRNGNGELEFIEDITNNPNGLTMDQALTEYVTWPGGSYPGYVQPEYFKGSETLPNSVEAGEKAAEHGPEEIWNGFNYTEEETSFRQSVGADIETFINEMEANFITGKKPFSEWDSYVEQVKAMGQDEYVKVQNEAYKRYNSN